MCQILRVSPGSWSAAGTYRQVQSHSPQSQVCVVMTEPSVEAFLPTMMTVQPSGTPPGPHVGQTGSSTFATGPAVSMTRIRNRNTPGTMNLAAFMDTSGERIDAGSGLPLTDAS